MKKTLVIKNPSPKYEKEQKIINSLKQKREELKKQIDGLKDELEEIDNILEVDDDNYDFPF